MHEEFALHLMCVWSLKFQEGIIYENTLYLARVWAVTLYQNEEYTLYLPFHRSAT